MNLQLRPLTDQQIAYAREMFEGGEVSITETSKRSGIHYHRLISLASTLGWVRKSSTPEINRARRIAAQGLHRRALDYLCALIPTGRETLDEEILIETRRMALILHRRAADSARAALRASESFRPARSDRAG